MQPFAAYGHAIVSVAAFALIVLVLGPVSARRKANDGVVSGAPPRADYSSLTWRLYRAHQNAVETIGVFAASAFAAMLAGAWPLAVNLAASLFLLSRIAHLAIHIRGIGAPDGGLRSMIYAAGWLACIILALLAIAAVFAGQVRRPVRNTPAATSHDHRAPWGVFPAGRHSGLPTAVRRCVRESQ